MTNFVSNYQKIKGFSSGVQIKLIAKMSTKEGELFVVKSHFTFLDAKIDSPYSTIKNNPWSFIWNMKWAKLPKQQSWVRVRHLLYIVAVRGGRVYSFTMY